MGGPSDWRGARVHAVAGIAHPQRFFDLLARLGVQAVPHAFGDHHAFTPADLALPGADVIVMGSRGQTGLTRVVLGSVARNVVQSSRASVLIVHGPARGG